MELISIKDYCKRENISDAGARKRVSSKLVKSVILDEMLYIVEENNEKQEAIKSLKNRLRNANDKIKLLTAEKQTIIDQREHIKKLEAKIETAEEQLKFLEAEKQTVIILREQIQELKAKMETLENKRDELYNNIFGHLTQIQAPK